MPHEIRTLFHLRNAVESCLKNKELDSILLLIQIRKRWSLIIGDSLAKKTHPSKIINRCLVVNVEDASYQHYLRYYIQPILEYIESICGPQKINRVRFVLGDVTYIEKLPKNFSLNKKKQKVSAPEGSFNFR